MKATTLIGPIVIVVLLILTLSQIVYPTPVFAATQFTITAIQSANGEYFTEFGKCQSR